MKLRELKCAEDLNCEFEHLMLWKQITEKKLNKILLLYLTSFYRSWRYDKYDNIERFSNINKSRRTEIGPVEIIYESFTTPWTITIYHQLSVKINTEEKVSIQLVVKGNQRRYLISIGKRNESYLPKTKL